MKVHVNVIIIVVRSMMTLLKYAVDQIMVSIAFCPVHILYLLGQCTCTNGELSCVCKLNTYNNKPYTGEACECTEANCYDQRLDFDPSVEVNN